MNDELAKETRDVSERRQLKLVIEDKAAILRTLDERILEATPDDGVEDEIQQADTYAEDIQLGILRLTSVLDEESTGTEGSIASRSLSRSPPPAPLSTGITETVTAARPMTEMSLTKVKLPRLTLKKFN